MMNWTIQAAFALLLLAIGSYTDLRTREVPDWISHGFIYFGFGLSIILTILYLNLTFIISSLIGFLVCFGLGWLMYKMGQWGGGDSKVIMGVGSLIGISLANLDLLTFLINTILVGAVYGIAWSIIVAFRNWKNFKKTYAEYLRTKTVVRSRIILYFVVAFGIFAAFGLASNFRIEIFLVTAIIFFLIHFWFVIKVVEKSCMIKEIPPSKLTEGDWIFKDVVVNGKKITGPKDLGVEKHQIAELKRLKVKTVWVKYGIPFVPSFLIAYILTIIVGSWYLGIFAYLA